MFRYGGHGGHHPESSGMGDVGQFHQGVLVGAVAVDADQHGPGAAALHLAQPLSGDGGHPAPVGGHRDDRHVLPAERQGGKVPVAVGQIRHPARGQGIGCGGGAAGGAEDQLIYHLRSLPYNGVPLSYKIPGGLYSPGGKIGYSVNNPCMKSKH